MRKFTEIKVTKVCFVPSWQELDKEGNVIGSTRTAVGQMSITKLPQGMQETLEKYILDALTSHEHKF